MFISNFTKAAQSVDRRREPVARLSLKQLLKTGIG